MQLSSVAQSSSVSTKTNGASLRDIKRLCLHARPPNTSFALSGSFSPAAKLLA